MQLSNNGVVPTDIIEALTVAREIFIATFGNSVNLDPSSTNGQTIQEIANAITTGDSNLAFLLNSINPYLATGIQLDAICSNLYLFRKQPTPSYALCQVTGLAETIIPSGSQVANKNGDLFNLIVNAPLTSITIGTNGSAYGTFQAVVSGSSIIATQGNIVKVVSSISGWDGVNNNPTTPSTTSGVNGSDIENDASLRARFTISKALASSGSYESVLSALNNIPGIGPLVLIENDTGDSVPIPNTSPSISVLAKTLYLICNQTSNNPPLSTDSKLAPIIAQVLFNYKSAGCGTQSLSTPQNAYNYAIPNTTPTQNILLKWDLPIPITLTFTLTFGIAQLGTLNQTIADLFNSLWVPTYTELGVTVFASNFIKILGDNGIINIKTLTLSIDGGTTNNPFIDTKVNQIITTPFLASNVLINVSTGA